MKEKRIVQLGRNVLDIESYLVLKTSFSHLKAKNI